MIKSVNKSALLAIGLMLFAAGASATPILVYDHNGYVTGVNNLQVGQAFFDAAIVGDSITYDQAFTDINRTPIFEGNISQALAASNSLAHFFDDSPDAPILVASDFSGLITKLVIPAFHISSMSPQGWYIIYTDSSGQWLSSTTNPGVSLLIPIASNRTTQGTSLVTFTPGDPAPSQAADAVPAPSSAALLGLGILLLCAALGRPRSARR